MNDAICKEKHKINNVQTVINQKVSFAFSTIQNIQPRLSI